MSTTKQTIDADDPRLTAYALGELPKEERAAFEALLKANPALLKQVAAVQRVAHLLEEDLKADAAEAPVAPLSEEQRRRVEAAGAAPAKEEDSDRVKLAPRRGLLLRFRPVVIAASVLGAGGLALMTFATLNGARAYRASVTHARVQVDLERSGERGWTAAPAPSAPPAPTGGRMVGALFREKSIEHGVGGQHAKIVENAFQPATGETQASTFAIDVDTAAYANVRRFLEHHQPPPADAVRIEELINYFTYDYAPPTGTDPFAAHVEVTGCPWRPANRLVRIGLKGRELDMSQRPAANLVFLIDVSGSMNEPQKLPLVKAALKALVAQTTERDRVAIVVYAGAAGLVLPPTTGDRRQTIVDALDRLEAGGSTNGGAGIELAYRVAIEGFKDGGINRVVLCSDGDWNVGLTGDALQGLIEQKARSDVFLTVLGFGRSYNDALSEMLADKGNGNYAVIDGLREAKKVLVEQAAGTLVTIAKDVKVQVEWNPAAVKGYRLIGYENRVMANQDFRDDAKDAGEIGAGHTVTALYEVEPTGAATEKLLTLRLRYKQPEGDTAKELAFDARDDGRSFDAASEDTRWAASVAGFGMLLRGSQHKGQATWALVAELAQGAVGKDPQGHRAELLGLIARARSLAGR